MTADPGGSPARGRVIPRGTVPARHALGVGSITRRASSSRRSAAELAAVEPGRACCRVAEREGLGVAATGQARDPVVARAPAIRLEHAEPAATPFDWASAADDCRLAWLRGRFLARGSLSLAGGRTHLEFVMPAGDAGILAGHLAGLGLPASLRTRRRAGVVTWKSAASVTHFLRLAGASATLLELESRTVARELHGDSTGSSTPRRPTCAGASPHRRGRLRRSRRSRPADGWRRCRSRCGRSAGHG